MSEESKLVVQVDLLSPQVHQQLAPILAVCEERGGERPQLLVEGGFSAGQVAGDKVGQSSSTLVLGSWRGLGCEHPPVENPHIRIVCPNRQQLSPARADTDAFHLGASADLGVQVNKSIFRSLALTPLLPTVPLPHCTILGPGPDQSRTVASNCQAFHPRCVAGD